MKRYKGVKIFFRKLHLCEISSTFGHSKAKEKKGKIHPSVENEKSSVNVSQGSSWKRICTLLIAFNRDVDPKNNGNSFFERWDSVPPAIFAACSPAYQRSKVAACKTDEDTLARTRGTRLTLPLHWMNARDWRFIWITDCASVYRSFIYRPRLPGGREIFAKDESDRGGTRGERGDAWSQRGRFCDASSSWRACLSLKEAPAVGISESKFRKSADGRRNVLIQGRTPGRSARVISRDSERTRNFASSLVFFSLSLSFSLCLVFLFVRCNGSPIYRTKNYSVVTERLNWYEIKVTFYKHTFLKFFYYFICSNYT